MQRVIATIEARMRSSRLPGKVLRPVMGRPLLELLVERLRRVPRLDGIVVATTVDPQDDEIEQLALRLGVGCFRGSEEDVLDRVVRAAQSARADVIVEVTGDCPLLDPGLVSRVISEWERGGADYCSNILERTYPRGMDVQVFPLAVLEDVRRRTDDPVHREHVSLYIYEHPELYRLRNVASDDPSSSELRLTVDTPADFELIRLIFEGLYPTSPAFSLEDILQLLRARPELVEINRGIRQKQVR